MKAVMGYYPKGDGTLLEFQQNAPTSYFQYIMTDPGATGDPNKDPHEAGGLHFANETFSKGSSVQYGSVNQRTVIADSWTRPGNVEDRWSQVATAQTGYTTCAVNVTCDLGTRVTYDQLLRQIDWTVPGQPIELLSSRIRYGNGDLQVSLDVKIGNGVQKFQWLKDPNPGILHKPGTGAALLPGGSNGGDFYINNSGGLGNVLQALWIGQTQDVEAAEPALFSHTAYTYDGSGEPYWGGSYYIYPYVHSETKLTSQTSANPPSNLNTYFSPKTAGGVFDVTQDIAALPAAITPTSWVSPAIDYVTPLNDHVAAPLNGSGGGGPPLAMGGWTALNGDITADACVLGFTCGTPFTGNGFYQRDLTAADGKKYFQTIITQNGATGSPRTAPVFTKSGTAGSFNIGGTTAGALEFANETFVSPGQQGVSTKIQQLGTAQLLSEPISGITYLPFYPVVTATTPFGYTALLNNGWAQGSGATPTLQLKQVVGFEGSAAVSGRPSFLGMLYGTQFDMTMAANGARDYTIVNIAPFATTYKRQIEGGVQTTSHALTDPLLVPGGSNGGNIGWAAGDSLLASWAWGSYPTYTPFGQSNMATVSYANLTTGDRTSLGSITMASPPLPWVAPFDIPVLPTGAGLVWPGQNTAW
ncbi:MAG: hypothetical protein HY940_07850 [Gammaproteobacteria bacterium]|nr:hypothetical protein [Gammaproteobacteria bacterium]